MTQLEAFCADNPYHHMVSSTGPGRFSNKFVQEYRFYLLGNKDKDPSRVLNFLLDPEWSLIVEDGISSALAEIDGIKNRRK